jgi:hypothetical protein
MRPIDERVVRAAIAGTLAPSDAADLVAEILAGYPREDAQQILDRLGLSTSGGLGYAARMAPDAQLLDVGSTPARRVLLDEIVARFGEEALWTFDQAANRISAPAYVAASDQLEALRSQGDTLALYIDGQFAFPAFQFGDARARNLTGRVNRALRADKDPWGTAAWWFQRDGRISSAPVDLLQGETRDSELLRLVAGTLTTVV